MLSVYVSGHGWGHATRTAEVLRVVRERSPALAITVTTAAPACLFENTVAPPLSVRALETDVGLRQKDALTIDQDATSAAWRGFMSGWEDLVAREAAWLRASAAHLVLADVPPLAFAAAQAAGLPAIGLGNFSWDWVYAHMAPGRPELGEAAAWARAAYGSAALLLRLPFAGDLRAFPRIEDVPLVVRRPRLDRPEAQRRLGLDRRPAVLFAFGGTTFPGLDVASLAALREYQVFLARPRVPSEETPEHVHVIDEAALARAGLTFPDLVAASDVVVSKPGYGIVSDCIGAATRLVYTERGDFPEYPVMVAQMPRYLPAVHVSNAELREGRIRAALARAIATPMPSPPRTDGAQVAAEKVLGFLRSPIDAGEGPSGSR